MLTFIEAKEALISEDWWIENIDGTLCLTTDCPCLEAPLPVDLSIFPSITEYLTYSKNSILYYSCQKFVFENDFIRIGSPNIKKLNRLLKGAAQICRSSD